MRTGRSMRKTDLDSVLSSSGTTHGGPRLHRALASGSVSDPPSRHQRRPCGGRSVAIEQRLDGSVWMRWRERVVALQPCLAERPCPAPKPERQPQFTRSASEKARARERAKQARRQLNETATTACATVRFGKPCGMFLRSAKNLSKQLRWGKDSNAALAPHPHPALAIRKFLLG